MAIVREKERRLMELEKAIGETEKSYDIVNVLLDRLSKPHENCQTLSKTKPCTLKIWPENDHIPDTQKY